MIWENAAIIRLSKRGEDAFIDMHSCIIDRLSLAINSGTSEYLLPDYILNIRRVTWKGRKITPCSHRQLRDTGYSGVQVGMPENYIYNNVSRQSIQFFPAPAESIDSASDNLYGTEIPARVIVEFYRTSDYISLRVPEMFRRRLLKAYINYRAYLQEGKGTNIKASKYFKTKWELLSSIYGDLIDDIINRPRKLVSDSTPIIHLYTPRFPHRSFSKFGVEVENDF
jgi:hypothetical protein